MKIGYISDIHIDINSKQAVLSIREILEDLLAVIKEKEYTHFIINGDITNDYKQTMYIIDLLQKQSKAKILYTIGNHDVLRKDRDSVTAYKEMYKQDGNIVNKVFELNKEWVIVGGFSWYDYSLETIGKSEYEYHRNRRNYWLDSRYVNWNKPKRFYLTDKEYCKEQMKELEEVIKSVGNKKIILINHFVPNKIFVEHTEDYYWNIGNAFMGTDLLTELTNKYRNIKKLCFGHTHKRYGKVEIDKVDYYSNPLGYYEEWKNKTFKKEIENIVMEIGIGG